MLGAEQEKWLLDGLGATGARWNVLAQQIPMCRLDDDPAPAQRLSMDMWDGYGAAKERVINGMAERRVSNPVVLTGDFHNNVAGELKANFDDPASPTVGVEFVGTSISSGGNGSAAIGLPAGGSDPVNPHIRFSSYQRGYVACDITRTRWQADFKVVPYVDRVGAPVSTRGSLVALNGVPGLQVL
jgi:alkaline phosphatase D